MPFALVFIGLIMIITGAKGTEKALGRQLVKDFTGQGNFFYWFVAIGSVGALGAVSPQFKTFSRVFMTLIIVAMILRNGGVFDKLMQAIQAGPVASKSEAAPVPTGNVSSGGGASKAVSGISGMVGTLGTIGSIASGGLLGGLGKIAGIASKFL